MDLGFERWRRVENSKREQIGRQLAQSLPTGFDFIGLEHYELGGLSHEMAVYSFKDARFSFIPGGSSTLGFEAEHWQPQPDELESWEGSALEYEIPSTLTEYLHSVTSRPRTIRRPALLVEQRAIDPTYKVLDLSAPELQQELRSQSGLQRVETIQRVLGISGGLHLERHPDGSIGAKQPLDLTHEQLQADLNRSGFRLPSSDEWEFLCGAGSSSLFRWGDHVPCDRSPVDQADDWNEHLKPNAFGLHIATDPYRFEVVNEPNLTRGGDGGANISGGVGYFLGWLPLATAYFDPEACHLAEFTPGYIRARRVLALS